MASKNSANECDWGYLIKAQDKVSTLIAKQEKDFFKTNKVKYKQELDQQLQEKNNIFEQKNDSKELQQNYYKAQLEAIKEYETKRKQEDRSFHKQYEINNLEIVQNKLKFTKLTNSREKMQEMIQLKKIQDEVNHEKKFEVFLKEQRKNKEKEEIQKKINEKNIKIQLANIEKLREKEMVEKKIQEMKENENKSKEMFEKKHFFFEEKMKKIQVPVKNEDYKIELIRKRNQEWESFDRERAEKREKIELEQKNRAVSEMKSQLKQQIEYKYNQKQKDWQENLKYYDLAKQKAQEEEIFLHLQKQKKIREREALKKNYDKQLEEKRCQSVDRLKMDSREKMIHKDIFNKLNSNSPILFSGIPGIYPEDSRLRDSNERSSSTNNNQRYFSINRVSSQAALRNNNNPSGLVVSSSFEKYPVINDFSQHNPITNPIGSILPRIFPGQRAKKGFCSQPRMKLNQ